MIEMYDSDIEKLMKFNKESKETINSLKTSNKNKDETIKRLKTENEDQHSEILKINNDASTIANELAERKNVISKLHSEIAKLNSGLADFKTIKSMYKQKVKKLTKKNDEMSETIVRLKSEDKTKSLVKELKMQKESLASKSEEIEKLLVRINTAEVKVGERDMALKLMDDANQKEVSALSCEIEKLEKLLKEKGKEITMLQREQELYKGQSMALMKAKEEISSVKRDMRRKVKELREQMATMERNHETQLMVTENM